MFACPTCLPITGQLEANKTYKQRRWTWIRCNDPRAEDDGTLTIVQRRSTRPGTKIEEDSYAVREMPLQFGYGRVFHLLNLHDADQPDVYETVITPRGTSCTCKAGLCRLTCKHVEVLQAVIESGGFERPEVDNVEPLNLCRVCFEPMCDEPGDAHPVCLTGEAVLAASDGAPVIEDVTDEEWDRILAGYDEVIRESEETDRRIAAREAESRRRVAEESAVDPDADIPF